MVIVLLLTNEGMVGLGPMVPTATALRLLLLLLLERGAGPEGIIDCIVVVLIVVVVMVVVAASIVPPAVVVFRREDELPNPGKFSSVKSGLVVVVMVVGGAG